MRSRTPKIVGAVFMILFQGLCFSESPTPCPMPPTAPSCPNASPGSWACFISLVTPQPPSDIDILIALANACSGCGVTATGSGASAQGGTYCQPRIFLRCGGVDASINEEGRVEVGINVGNFDKHLLPSPDPATSIEILRMYDTTGGTVTSGTAASCGGCHVPWNYGPPSPNEPVGPPYNFDPYVTSTIQNVNHFDDITDLFEGIDPGGGNNTGGTSTPGSLDDALVSDLQDRYCECCSPDATDTMFEPLNDTASDPDKVGSAGFCAKMKKVLVELMGKTSPLCKILNVSKAGLGATNGLVVSSPVGIDCGTDCKASYSTNKSVTLTASATAPSVFDKWTQDCSGTSMTCSVTMSSSKNVTGNFKLTQTLTVTKVGSGTVTSNPTGISCGATCLKIYPAYTIVTLTAVAASGYLFTGWSNACTNASGPCIVTMDAAKTATATFKALKNLTVNISPTASGTVSKIPAGYGSCGTNCTKYVHNDVVMLTPSPLTGFVFSSWSGGGCTGTGPCSVTMDLSKTVTATFKALRKLTATTIGSGSIYRSLVEHSPCGPNCFNYPSGVTVVMTPIPDPGSVFSVWTVCTSVSGTNCNALMTGDRTATAKFVPISTTTTIGPTTTTSTTSTTVTTRPPTTTSTTSTTVTTRPPTTTSTTSTTVTTRPPTTTSTTSTTVTTRPPTTTSTTSTTVTTRPTTTITTSTTMTTMRP